jgi:hypothetical protein
MNALRQHRGWALAMAAAAAVVGCDDDGPSGPGDEVTQVVVSATELQPVIGDTVQLTAVPRDSRGRVLSGKTAQWSATPADRVELAAEGVTARVTGLSEGPVTLTARVDGRTGSAELIIIQPTVASLELDVDSLVIEEGADRLLVATLRDSKGREIQGKFVGWTSSDPLVAQVSPLGTVMALRPGTTEITATAEAHSATARVRVTADHAFDLLFVASPTTGEWTNLFRLDLNEVEATPQPLLPDGTWVGDPASAPDGSQFAFVGWVEGQGWGIYRASVSGGAPVLLDPMEGDHAPFCGQVSWSPDGLKLAYMCDFQGAGTDLVTIDAEDGGNWTVLTGGDEGDHYWPSWSPELPDGSLRIAYSRYLDGESRIWTMAADGSDRIPLTEGYQDSQPAWSPDGTTLVFRRGGPGSQVNLLMVGADGTELRALFIGGLTGSQLRPTWSPDGGLIAFSSRHESWFGGPGSWQIYTVRPDGSRLVRRTNGEMNHFSPAWLRR